MQSVPINIVGGTNPARFPKLGREATYNMIVTDAANGSKGLVPYAGYELSKVIKKDGEARALYVSPSYGHMIAVIDEGVYALTVSGEVVREGNVRKKLISSSQIGTLATDSGAVEIAENANKEIAIVDGLFQYLFNYGTNTFSQISPGFKPISITYQDSYFQYAVGDTNEFRMSESNDGTQFPAEYLGAIETKNANNCIAVRAHGRQLYVFGSTVTEIWQDLPTINQSLVINMPYKRDNSVNIDYGCLNKETIADGFGFLVWLAVSEEAGPVIVYSEGSNPQPLSTDGIDFMLSNLTDPSDASAFLYEQDGHIFYQITFKTDNLTLAYDFKEGIFISPTDEKLNAHPAKKVVYFEGSHYFLSYEDGSLYEMNSTFDSYDGHAIPRIRRCSPDRLPDYEDFRVSKVQVVADNGYSENQLAIDLSLSKDGSVSFGNNVRRELGPIGRTRQLTRWYDLGWSRDWTFQFSFYGKSYYAIVDATMEIAA
tara:strand:+ start:1553 stop:3004 length:1452 start_codon:yes stop_codon:yes gene_type:complete